MNIITPKQYRGALVEGQSVDINLWKLGHNPISSGSVHNEGLGELTITLQYSDDNITIHTLRAQPQAFVWTRLPVKHVSLLANLYGPGATYDMMVIING